MKNITGLLGMLIVACMLFTNSNLIAQVSVNGKDCVGTWKTIDDETGRVKSHVQVFKKGDKFYAKIVQLLDPQTLKDSGEKRFEDIKCDKCPANRGKDKPTIGLEMVWDMTQSSNKWSGGSIMDPKNGKVYTCTMWMDDSDKTGNTLMVRGWVAMFYRTQSWTRVN